MHASKFDINKFIVLVSFLLNLLLFSCSPKEKNYEKELQESKNRLEKIKIQLNWLAESEHGGYFSALVEKEYFKQGLDVELLSGGPGVPMESNIALGRAQFGVINADKLLQVRQNGLKLIALLAPYQKSPLCLISHAEKSFLNFEDMSRAKALSVATSEAFYKVLIHKNSKLKKIVTFPYSPANFLAHKDYLIQGYIHSEPLFFAKKGVKTKAHLLADIAYNPYTSILVCHEQLLKEKPELVRKVVQASQKGWLLYQKNPSRAHQEIIKKHPAISSILAESAKTLAPYLTPPSNKPFGWMAQNRWEELKRQLIEAKVIRQNTYLKKTSSLFTNQFLSSNSMLIPMM